MLLVREKSKSTDGFGFIPGRGFVGRVIEAGYAVTDLRRGEWVLGSLEMSKVSV